MLKSGFTIHLLNLLARFCFNLESPLIFSSCHLLSRKPEHFPCRVIYHLGLADWIPLFDNMFYLCSDKLVFRGRGLVRFRFDFCQEYIIFGSIYSCLHCIRSHFSYSYGFSFFFFSVVKLISGIISIYLL